MMPTLPPPRQASPAAAARSQATTDQDDLFTGLSGKARTRVHHQRQPAQIEDFIDDDLPRGQVDPAAAGRSAAPKKLLHSEVIL